MVRVVTFSAALAAALLSLSLGEASAQAGGSDLRATSHGTWTRGPGVYAFRICAAEIFRGTASAVGLPEGGGIAPPASDDSGRGRSAGAASGSQATAGHSGCDIVLGFFGTTSITIEGWGGGGGGGTGAGQSSGKPIGGEGGGGGGGGGYGKKILTVQALTSGAIVWYVQVGSKGAGGLTTGVASVRDGGHGGLSQVRVGTASGAVLVSSTGGTGGYAGYSSFGNNGGGPGVGAPNPWAGTSGLPGGDPTSCDGMAGGFGGAGGGPGRTGPGYINDGGNGGHGGYRNSSPLPQCLNHGSDYLLTGGVKGGDGLVKITW